MPEKMSFTSAILSLIGMVVLIGSGAFGTVLIMLREGDVKVVDTHIEKADKQIAQTAQQMLDMIIAIQGNVFSIKFISEELLEIEGIKRSQSMIQDNIHKITIELTKISSRMENQGSS